MDTKKVILTIFIILCIILLLGDHIKVFMLNKIIISRGILVPNCFWYSISQKLVKDGSGVDLFYKLKKRSEVPVTYMFGYKTYIITKESHIKSILDNSPYPFGPGRLKYKFFKSFMKDNVGVSTNTNWKKRRILNENVLDTDMLHQYADKINNDTKNTVGKYLNKNKLIYSDFVKVGQEMAGKIIFNTTDVHPDVYRIFSEANTVKAFYAEFKLDNKTSTNYVNYLKKHIKNPINKSLVQLCVKHENSVHEIIQQIPHFIFPIVGLYLTTIPRLLLILSNHPKELQKLVNEIKDINGEGNLTADEIYNLKYLRKCIMEMLRLNNPVITTFRTALKDVRLENHNFRKGDQLLILNNPILRNPEVFNQPDKYIPERWDSNLEDSYHAISFNQGQQRCPAKELAIFQVQSFIVNFVTITGIIHNINKLQTEKIETDKIGQVINTCNLEFKLI